MGYIREVYFVLTNGHVEQGYTTAQLLASYGKVVQFPEPKCAFGLDVVYEVIFKRYIPAALLMEDPSA